MPEIINIESTLANANRLHGEAVQIAATAIQRAMECGDELLKLKGVIQPGSWEAWLDEHFAGGARTARQYMQLARNRAEVEAAGAESISQARKLIATPKPDPKPAAEPADTPEEPINPVEPVEGTVEDPDDGETRTTFDAGEISADEPEDEFGDDDPFDPNGRTIAPPPHPHPHPHPEPKPPATPEAITPEQMAEINLRVKDIRNRLHALKRETVDLAESTRAGHWIYANAIEADFGKITSALAQAEAVRLCPYCGGVGCRVCGGAGYLNPQADRQVQVKG